MTLVTEEDLLNEFRKSLNGFPEDEASDFTLMAILKAADMDKIKAMGILQQYVEKRFRLTDSKSFNYNCEVDPEVRKNLKYKIIGTDNEDRVVIWAQVGRWQLKRLLQEGYKAEIYKHVFKMGDEIFRLMYKHRKETGNRFKMVLLADLKDSSVMRLSHYETIQVALEFGRISEPLSLLVDKVYVINGPRILPYLLSLLKTVLSRESLAKLEVLGSDEKKWLEILDKSIPIDLIPADYGGLGPKAFV